MKKKEMLNLKIESPDFDKNVTIKDYFKMLLQALWEEGEGFSGKRPLGSSGWEYDLYKPLIKAGIITGEFDEDGCICDYDTEAAPKIIFNLITECFL